jgi:hypothetical protein
LSQQSDNPNNNHEIQKSEISPKSYRKLALTILAWFSLATLVFALGIYFLIDPGKEKTNQEKTAEVKELSFKQKISLFFKKFFEPKEEIKKPDETVEEDPVIENRFMASTWFSDYEAMKNNIQYYNEIHPFIYGMKGKLNNNGELSSSWGHETKIKRMAEMRSLNPKIVIIPTIFRWENKGEKIYENIGMGGRNDIRDKHIQNILYEVDTYGYDGIDIDYEGMNCEKKWKFEEFIVLLSKELKKRKKLLSVAVHPKTPSKTVRIKKCGDREIEMDFQENWRGPHTHDYKFLGQHVDKVKIMAYELHPRKYHNPGPGPQAPNTWLEDIIEYSVERVPPEKLYMAVPTYGYDWALNCKARAKAVYFSTAQKIKSENHIEYQPTDMEAIFDKHPERSKTWKNLSKFMYIHKDKVYEDPSLWYKSEGCDRLAFYMNGRAFQKKMNLLRSYNLAGFSFWQLLSDNDPEINRYLTLLTRNQLPPIPMAERKVKKLEAEIARLEEERKQKELEEQAKNKKDGEQKETEDIKKL